MSDTDRPRVSDPAEPSGFVVDEAVLVDVELDDLAAVEQCSTEAAGGEPFEAVGDGVEGYAPGDRVALAAPDAIVMHPGPMNRGVEITGEVADGNRSVILEQVTNGVAIRMAILYLLAGGRSDAANDS